MSDLIEESAIKILEELGYEVTIKKRRVLKGHNFVNGNYGYNITVRSARILSAIGINSPSDLLESEVTYDSLCKLPNCGKKSTCEIISYINRLKESKQ